MDIMIFTIGVMIFLFSFTILYLLSGKSRKVNHKKIEPERIFINKYEDEIYEFGFDLSVVKLNAVHEIRISKPARRSSVEHYCTCGTYCKFFGEFTLDKLKALQSPDSVGGK